MWGHRNPWEPSGDTNIRVKKANLLVVSGSVSASICFVCTNNRNAACSRRDGGGGAGQGRGRDQGRG